MIFRGLILLLPLCLWAWLIIYQRLTIREITAAFLGMAWYFNIALVLNIFFIDIGVISISVDESLFYGVPLDWIIAQSIICGALVPLVRLQGWNTGQRLLLQSSLILVIYYFAGADLTGLASGLALLSIIIVCALPAMYLSDWTANDSHVCKRSLLQSISWVIFLFWLFPSTIFHLTADSWAPFLQRDLILTGLYCLPLLLPAYLLISALYQFAVEGGGTAFPYDPPKQLVTNGVYRYISNPMQVGICLSMGWWGVVIQNYWVSISALITVVLFIVFKDVCNGSCAIGVNNHEWEAYQLSVPKWFPRLKSVESIKKYIG